MNLPNLYPIENTLHGDVMMRMHVTISLGMLIHPILKMNMCLFVFLRVLLSIFWMSESKE